MSASPYDSPAGRLFQFLQRMKEQSQAAAPPGQTLAGRLGLVLELDHTAGPSLLFARLGDVLALPEQVREAVQVAPGVSSTFSDFLPEVEKYLASTVNTLSNNGIQPPPETLLVAMKLCAEQLSLSAPEDVPELDDLLEVRDELLKLLNDVIQADIDSALAQFIAEHLHELLDAIDRFRITGIAPIRSALSQLLGDIDFRRVADEKFEDSPEARSLSGRLLAAAGHLADMVNIAAGSTVLTAATMHALSSGAHPH